MSWFTPVELPESKYFLFGREGGKRLAEELKIPLLGQIPIVQSICESGDSGKPVALNDNSLTGLAFQDLARQTVTQVNFRNENLKVSRRVIVRK
jgi:ATP-binding protein involved in chromosome partitioning